MPRSRCTTRIAIDAPQPMKSGPEILQVRAQRPRPRLGDHVGGFGEIRGQKEHDEELDQLDRLVLDRPDLDPEARAVDLLAEENQQHEEHERGDDPEILVRSEAAELREAGPATIASTSETSSQSCCCCASSGESRATIARPSAESTTASAGNTSSRTVVAGCHSTHTQRERRQAARASTAARSCRAARTKESARPRPARRPSARAGGWLRRSVRDDRGYEKPDQR